MKKTLFLIILFQLSICFGQRIEQNEITGKWKIIDVQTTMKGGQNNPNIKKVKQGFINTLFHFNSNGVFNIKFSKNAPPFFKELETMNNTNWKYKNNGVIAIGKEEDKYTQMEILPSKTNGNYYFNVIGMIFKVNKLL